MTLSHRPTLEALRSALVPALERAFVAHGEIQILERSPLVYASSSPSEVVTCDVGNGVSVHVLCKYAGPPDRLDFGQRSGTAGEALVYQQVLPVLGVTKPTFYGTHIDRTSGETWLFLEYLPRSERVSRVPAQAAMAEAAHWLGEFHARAELELRNGFAPPIPCPDQYYYLSWAHRTLRFTEPLRAQYPWMERACGQFADAAQVLVSAPSTVVHGEFYPQNVLWDEGVIIPVDWESAMIGAGEIDLASLIENWGPDHEGRYQAAYAAARWPAGPPSAFPRRLAAAKYYWAVRWLGVRADWTLNGDFRPRYEELRRLAENWPEISKS